MKLLKLKALDGKLKGSFLLEKYFSSINNKWEKIFATFTPVHQLDLPMFSMLSNQNNNNNSFVFKCCCFVLHWIMENLRIHRDPWFRYKIPQMNWTIYYLRANLSKLFFSYSKKNFAKKNNPQIYIMYRHVHESKA